MKGLRSRSPRPKPATHVMKLISFESAQGARMPGIVGKHVKSQHGIGTNLGVALDVHWTPQTTLS